MLQASLHSALEEKKSFAKATEALKLNTAKVEQNFKQMKQELSANVQRMADLEKENAELVSKLDSTDSVLTQQASSVPADQNPGLQQEHVVLQEHMSALRHSYEVSQTLLITIVSPALLVDFVGMICVLCTTSHY